MHVFSLVHAELERSGLNQAKLARRLGISESWVSRLLGAPGNWMHDTVSDLLYAISGSEIAYGAHKQEGLMTDRNALPSGYDAWRTDPGPAYREMTQEEQIEEADRMDEQEELLRDGIAAALSDDRGDIPLARIREIVNEELAKLKEHEK